MMMIHWPLSLAQPQLTSFLRMPEREDRHRCSLSVREEYYIHVWGCLFLPPNEFGLFFSDRDGLVWRLVTVSGACLYMHISVLKHIRWPLRPLWCISSWKTEIETVRQTEIKRWRDKDMKKVFQLLIAHDFLSSFFFAFTFSRRSIPERLTVSTGTFSPRQVGWIALPKDTTSLGKRAL